jgi:hypothetical protein
MSVNFAFLILDVFIAQDAAKGEGASASSFLLLAVHSGFTTNPSISEKRGRLFLKER